MGDKDPRRLFVGDLHGCRGELDALLADFAFRPGVDRLFSVGDVVGKGPDVPGALRRLTDLGAGIVQGNHEYYLLQAARTADHERKERQRVYLAALGPDAEAWTRAIAGWPLWIDLGDILLVHAGLEPGKGHPSEMSPKILRQIRTWDGKGEDLKNPADPPWFECVDPGKIVVFGHWAELGRVDLPRFKGLDTGCVYGRKLTGWCPEEDRFYEAKAAREYVPMD